MLNFEKLVAQIKQVGDKALADRQPEELSLERAVAAYRAAAETPLETAARLKQAAPWVLWPTALPVEPFGQQAPLEPDHEPVTVVAADGSQIMPSRHQIYNCYLLNIGTAVVSYRTTVPPKLDSTPRLYHKPEDLYPLLDRRRVLIDELYVSLERGLLELETIASLSAECRKDDVPVMSLLDGSLVPWSIEKMPDCYQQAFFARTAAALESMRTYGLPLVGYISHSRSSELINCLRVTVCPHETSDCPRQCAGINEDRFPCSEFWPATDRQMLYRILPPGARSSATLSGSAASRLLPEAHQTCFVYLNTGYEVARLEFPRWLADSAGILNNACKVVLEQSAKGFGYPVCLTEAHHQAIIRAADRNRFFALLERHLVGLGEEVHLSPKENRKRWSPI